MPGKGPGISRFGAKRKPQKFETSPIYRSPEPRRHTVAWCDKCRADTPHTLTSDGEPGHCLKWACQEVP